MNFEPLSETPFNEQTPFYFVFIWSQVFCFSLSFKQSSQYFSFLPSCQIFSHSWLHFSSILSHWFMSMTNSSQSSFSSSSSAFWFLSIKSKSLFLIETSSLPNICLNSIFLGISVCKNYSSKISLMCFASESGTFETSWMSSYPPSLESIG